MLTVDTPKTSSTPHIPETQSIERGMTLVETIVAMTVTMIITLALVSTIAVFTKSEASTVNSANSASSTRMVLMQLQHDIQSAGYNNQAVLYTNCSGSQLSVGAMAYELILTVQPSGSEVIWQYNTSTEQLTRQVGCSTTPALVLTSVSNGTTSDPMFSYFDHCQNNLGQESAITASGIATQTTVIQVKLDLASVDAAPYGSTTSVNIMNRSPGNSPCSA